MGKENGERVISLTAINMKVIICLTKNMAMEFFNGSLETYIKVIILKMKDKVMEKCFGQMDPYIKDSGLEEYSMDMEY